MIDLCFRLVSMENNVVHVSPYRFDNSIFMVYSNSRCFFPSVCYISCQLPGELTLLTRMKDIKHRLSTSLLKHVTPLADLFAWTIRELNGYGYEKQGIYD